jgi:hypothetical protein
VDTNKLVDIEKFKLSDGKTIDYSAYRKAKVANGENCCVCGEHAGFEGLGIPRLCYFCEALKAGKTREHAHCVRCPKCGHIWPVVGDLMGEARSIVCSGDLLQVTCPECEATFAVELNFEVTFTNPWLNKFPERKT